MKRNRREKPEEHIRPRLLLKTRDNIRSEMVTDILRRNGIASYAQGRGIGGVLDVYVGYSLYGDDIYVSEADWARAQRIIEALPPEENE